MNWAGINNAVISTHWGPLSFHAYAFLFAQFLLVILYTVYWKLIDFIYNYISQGSNSLWQFFLPWLKSWAITHKYTGPKLTSFYDSDMECYMHVLTVPVPEKPHLLCLSLIFLQWHNCSLPNMHLWVPEQQYSARELYRVSTFSQINNSGCLSLLLSFKLNFIPLDLILQWRHATFGFSCLKFKE